MINLQLLSDLHQEIDVFPKFNQDYYKTNSKIAVLSGDIAHSANLVNVIKSLFPYKYKDGSFGPSFIFFVCGNHEYYLGDGDIDIQNSYIQKTVDEFNKKNPFQKIIFLNNNKYLLTINDLKIRFAGGTLWTDFNLYENHIYNSKYASKHMNDYFLINGLKNKYGKNKLTTNEVRDRFFETKEFLTNVVNEKFDGKTIIVTHHLPTSVAIDKKYDKDILNTAFASNLDELITENVDYWFCGHTHSSSVHKFNNDKTSLIINPSGYFYKNFDRENPLFNPKMTINIE